METYKIKGGRNPEYKILRTEEMPPKLAENAINYNKESIIYYMQGITRTGKVSKEVLMCYRYNNGTFLKVL